VAGRGTPATALLARLGIAHSVHVYEHDPRRGAYGLEASDALGVAPERVFKTLVAEVDGALAVGVVPVAGQLDLKALAAAAGGKKAVMAAWPRPNGRPVTWRAASPRWGSGGACRW
jgi:Cys-tRNA(Pro)/Cys-tRNA(Cys) deacylase